MTDRDALIRAVLSAPDDDHPRLLYADYLDECGEAERAELIRVQCELARPHPCKNPNKCIFGPKRLPFSPMQTKPFCGVQACRDSMWPRERLHIRERELRDIACRNWEPQPSAGLSPEWQRGFISTIRCSWFDWLKYHESLYWHPEQNRPWTWEEPQYTHDPASGEDRVTRYVTRTAATAQPITRVELTTENGLVCHLFEPTGKANEWRCDRWPTITFVTP